MKVVYVVEVSYGTYDDNISFPAVALETVSLADQYVKDLTQYIKDLNVEYHKKARILNQIDFLKIDEAEGKQRFEENKDIIQYNHDIEQELLNRCKHDLSYVVDGRLITEDIDLVNLNVDYYEIPIVDTMKR